MRAFWLTDIHLNFLHEDAQEHFLDRVSVLEPDAILLTGDVGEAHTVGPYLRRLDDRWQTPIYFVLGNHDFYFGSIAKVRGEMQQVTAEHPRLVYLTQRGVEQLAPGVGLVGHDGWADGRAGDYERSLVMMNDYRLIDELAHFTKQDRLERLHAMGDEAAAHIRRWLPEALAQYEHVVLLTHVPPLREACWHSGQISDDHWAPHFCCVAVGEAILDIMREHSQRRLTVLCGHTHGRGECRPLENVEILTGGAEYRHPEIQREFEF